MKAFRILEGWFSGFSFGVLSYRASLVDITRVNPVCTLVKRVGDVLCVRGVCIKSFENFRLDCIGWWFLAMVSCCFIALRC